MVFFLVDFLDLVATTDADLAIGCAEHVLDALAGDAGDETRRDAGHGFQLGDFLGDRLVVEGVDQVRRRDGRLNLRLGDVGHGQQAPAVAFVDRYVEAKATQPIRSVAKILGMKEKDFIASLEATGIMYRLSGKLTPAAEHVAAALVLRSNVLGTRRWAA